MIPRVAQRGHSFRGAGQYYLHDKQADTSERVAWTQTINLPTEDAGKAISYMAYTAMHADWLKKQAGVPSTGRKSTAGPVYSYSLAWHPSEQPEQEHMQEVALETIELLGLQEHEAVLVAHNETDHEHVHCIINLVHPETGKMASPHKDFLRLSEWAEGYEKEYGHIYCPDRVKNNELRKAQENKEKIIKHREEKMQRAQLVEGLYNQSDGGKAFIAALEVNGYTLAQGDRRGYVLVDDHGNIYSLSRQLKGQRAGDIKARLNDIKAATLPHAKEVSDSRKYFDRDAYEIKWQQKLVDESIASKGDSDLSKEDGKEAFEHVELSKSKGLKTELSSGYDDSALRKLDRSRELEQHSDAERLKALKTAEEYYESDRERLMTQINELKKTEAKTSLLHKFTGKQREIQDELEALRLTLDNLEVRHAEYLQKVEETYRRAQVEIDTQLQEEFGPNKHTKDEKEQEFEERMRQRQKERREKGREPGLDYTM